LEEMFGDFKLEEPQISSTSLFEFPAEISLQSISPPPRKQTNNRRASPTSTTTTPISPIRQRFTQNRRCNATTQTAVGLTMMDENRPLSSALSTNSLISGGSYSPPNQVNLSPFPSLLDDDMADGNFDAQPHFMRINNQCTDLFSLME